MSQPYPQPGACGISFSADGSALLVASSDRIQELQVSSRKITHSWVSDEKQQFQFSGRVFQLPISRHVVAIGHGGSRLFNLNASTHFDSAKPILAAFPVPFSDVIVAVAYSDYLAVRSAKQAAAVLPFSDSAEHGSPFLCIELIPALASRQDSAALLFAFARPNSKSISVVTVNVSLAPPAVPSAKPSANAASAKTALRSNFSFDSHNPVVAAAYQHSSSTLALLDSARRLLVLRCSSFAAPSIACSRSLPAAISANDASMSFSPASGFLLIAVPGSLMVWETAFGTLQDTIELISPIDASDASLAVPAKGKRSRSNASSAIHNSDVHRQLHIASSPSAQVVAVLSSAGVSFATLRNVHANRAASLADALGALVPQQQMPMVLDMQPPRVATLDPVEFIGHASAANGVSTKKKTSKKAAKSDQQQPSWPQEDDAETQAALQKLLRADISYKEFLSTFNSFLETEPPSHVAAEPPRKKTKKKQTDVGEQSKQAQESAGAGSLKKRRVLSQSFVSQVAAFCLQRNDLWEPLNVLVASNSLSAHYFPALVSTLIEKKQLLILEQCLLHVHDLPEPDLIQVVRFALSSIAASEAAGSSSGPKKGGKRGGDAMAVDEVKGAKVSQEDHLFETFLHLVLSSPKGDAFAMQALKALNSAELLILLQYLIKWVRRYWEAPDQQIRKQVLGSRIPTFSQVLDWLIMVLDAQFTQLLLNRDCERALQSLQELVNAQHLPFCEDVEKLRGIIRQLLLLSAEGDSGHRRKEQPGDYSIEVLFL